MGLFSNLFRKSFRQIQKLTKKTYHDKLHDIIFDWFNASTLNIKEFEEKYFSTILKRLKTNENYKFNENEEVIVNVKLFCAITYLTYYNPENKFIASTIKYLVNNNTYDILTYMESNTVKNLLKDHKKIKQVISTSYYLLKLFHSVFFKIDKNFSRYSSVREQICYMKYDDNYDFRVILQFIKNNDFVQKIDLLANLYSYYPYDYKTKEYKEDPLFQEEIKQLCIEEINKFNQTSEFKIDFELYSDLIRNVINYNKTKKWIETDYKKQRYLKISDFDEVVIFNERYKETPNKVIEHFEVALKYIEPLYRNKIYNQFISHWVKLAKIDIDWFNYLLQNTSENNKIFEIENIFVPLFKKYLELISYDDKTRKLFENLLYSEIQDFKSTFPNKKGIALIKKIAERIKDEKTKKFILLKYQGYYSKFTIRYGRNHFLFDQKFTILNNLITDLSYIYPVALKNISKIYDSETESIGEMDVNIDGKDQKMHWSDINAFLQQIKSEFQFVPIPLFKRDYYRDGIDDYRFLFCSMAFLNKSQFEYLINRYFPEKFPLTDTEYIYYNIHFHKDSSQTFMELKKENENSFLANTKWKWFKDKYIDTLTNKESWYNIMNVMLDSKGTKKPNPNWLSSAMETIKKMDVDQFLIELNVLINTSIKENFWFLDENKQVIRGFMWICEKINNQKSLLLLKTIIEAAYTKIPNVGPRSAALGNLGLGILVSLNSPEGFAILNLLKHKTKYQRFIKILNKYIDLFMENYKESIELLADKSIPDFGFKNGVKIISYSDFKVEFYFKNNKLSKRWIYDKKTSTSIPKNLKGKYPEFEKEISEEFKSINKIFKSLNNRLQSYWLNNRTWNYPDWETYILNKQLLNPLLQNMVWKNQSDNKSFILINNKFLDYNNSEYKPDKNSIISLWHPVDSNEKEIRNWQNFLILNEISQPERQIFRESYPFSEKELKMTESPRFNDHFLEVKKLMAIANATGWIFTYVHEGRNWPRTYIKSLNITAHLKCDYSRFDYAIPTKGLFFTKGDTTKINNIKEFDKLKLSDIPSIVRSEICRNIDLFIAKTSIANDIELSQKTELLEHYRED